MKNIETVFLRKCRIVPRNNHSGAHLISSNIRKSLPGKSWDSHKVLAAMMEKLQENT